MTGSIKAIEAASVHRICSGQVVIDLATAAKELLENSLDAGATTVVIKFKNYGVDLVEVADDGSGISPDDYDGIGLKHHTSKLSSFENLDDLETFGFRGEAISSLCALGDLQIVTATREDAPRATKLEFDHHGVVVSRKVASAKRGTTASVANLFSTLPVRRKEFSKNCKREFAKAITLLQGYALIKTNVKISVFHQPPNGKSTLQLSTNGNNTIRENITNIFGAKILTSLEPLSLKLDIDIRHIGGKQTTESVEVVGYISKCAHGEGRSSSDRQFFYVNSRPCIQPKIARTFNEIYRSYNSHQYPFILVDFRLASGTFDINLAPDKRTILLHEEQSLIKELSDQLTQFYDSFQHSFPLNQFLTSAKPRRTEHIKQETPELQRQDLPPINIDETSEFPLSQTPRQQSQIIDLSSTEKIVSNVTGGFKERIASYALDSPDGVRTIDATLTPVPEVTIPQSSPSERVRRAPEEESEESDVDERPIRQTSRNVKRTITTIITPSQMEAIIGPSKRGRTDEDTSARRSAQTSLKDHFLRKADDSRVRGRGNDVETLGLLSQEQVSTMLATIDTNEEDELTGEDDDVLMQVEQDDAPDEESSMEDEHDDSVVQEENIEMEEEPNEIEDITPVTAQEKSMKTPTKSEHNLFRFRQKNAVHNLRTTTANITLESIKSQHNSLKQIHHRTSRHGTIAKKDYSEPNEKAEERLSLTVSKEDFSRMRIVGQFNLGFIIAVRERQLDSDVEDVFIIDQHASDEKYNFERLQTETVMQVQNLARPQQLELTAMEESIVLDHLDIFKLNGFDIQSSPSKRCILHAIPMSGNTIFSLSDLEELIHLIQLQPDKKSIRCSKARAMFAMRACRSSIMIGKALSEKMMERIVRNLGGLDKPWSCPHGRPTMRHLTELDGWTSWDGDIE